MSISVGIISFFIFSMFNQIHCQTYTEIYVNGRVGQDLTITCPVVLTVPIELYTWTYIDRFTNYEVPPQQSQTNVITGKYTNLNTSLLIRNLVIDDTLNTPYTYYKLTTKTSAGSNDQCRIYLTVLPKDQPISNTEIGLIVVGTILGVLVLVLLIAVAFIFFKVFKLSKSN